MNRKLFILIIFLATVILFVKFASHEKVDAAEIEDFSDYSAVTFPVGSYFSVILQQPIDSTINKEDDLFEAIFPADVYVDETLVISKGSKAIGRILTIERAHQGRHARINLRFLSIVPAYGAGEIPIKAALSDFNPDGSLGGQLTHRSKVKVIVHDVERIGPYGQAVETGPRLMGDEIYIPPGERWVIKLEEPARFIIPK